MYRKATQEDQSHRFSTISFAAALIVILADLLLLCVHVELVSCHFGIFQLFIIYLYILKVPTPVYQFFIISQIVHTSLSVIYLFWLCPHLLINCLCFLGLSIPAYQLFSISQIVHACLSLIHVIWDRLYLFSIYLHLRLSKNS